MEEKVRSVEVVMGLGSNHGDRATALSHASHLLSTVLSEYRCSAFYETPAIGTHAYGTYLNAVAIGQTTMAAADLDAKLKSLELAAGRDAAARERGEVPLDIDIVIYDSRILRPRDFSQSFFRIGYNQLLPTKQLPT